MLRQIGEAITAGEQDFDGLLQRNRQQLETSGFRIDYLEIREATGLRPATVQDLTLIHK